MSRSPQAIPGLAAAPLSVEFAPGNDGLRIYAFEGVEAGDGRVAVNLAESRAVCRPAAEVGARCDLETCGSEAAGARSCC